MHVKFPAIYVNQDKTKIGPSEEKKETYFLALDKCLPKREFLQVLKLNSGEKGLESRIMTENTNLNELNHGLNPQAEIEMYFDAEWLGILSCIDELYDKMKEKTRFFEYSKENPYSLSETGWRKSKEFEIFEENVKMQKERIKVLDLKIKRENFTNQRSDLPGKKVAVNQQTSRILEIIGMKPEKFEGILYYGDNVNENFQNPIKNQIFMGNNEEIDLDLEEETQDLVKAETKAQNFEEKKMDCNVNVEELPFCMKK